MAEHKSNIEIKPGSERGFGIVFACIFLVVGLYPIINGDVIRYWSLVISFVFLVVALLSPRLLYWPNIIWFKFGIFLGSIISPVIMLMVFVVTVVPIGIALRMLGKDVLKLKLDPDSESYWVIRKDKPQSMKKQF